MTRRAYINPLPGYKAYHHTDQWSEDTGDGISYAGAIQKAADRAAKTLSQ